MSDIKHYTGRRAHLIRLAMGWRRVASRAESDIQRFQDRLEARRLITEATR